jgi:GTP cyclohydrolase II
MMTDTLPSLTRPASSELLFEAESTIPTWHGDFRCVVFRHRSEPEKEHVALIQGDVEGSDVLVRVHSECLTGEAFGSLKCDCALQLDLALARIGREGRGLVVYLRQEGRDIGLTNKIRAYALQSRGFDTVDANRALDLPVDARRYDAAAALLRRLKVGGIRLMTNNPDKIQALRDLGVSVDARVPHVVFSYPESAAYLDTKRRRMHHELPPELT